MTKENTNKMFMQSIVYLVGKNQTFDLFTS